jgi:hypothetical protein
MIEPRTSVEKLHDLIAEAKSAKPTDEQTARLRQAFSSLLPMILRFAPIPEDPAELDKLLLVGARVCLRLRSDDAEQPASIAELVEPEPAIEGEATEVPT